MCVYFDIYLHTVIVYVEDTRYVDIDEVYYLILLGILVLVKKYLVMAPSSLLMVV